MYQPEVKICGLTRRSDAELVAGSGACYGGAILATGGKRSITPETAAEIFAGLMLTRVGVFVDADSSALDRAARTAVLDVVQLHGSESGSDASRVRSMGDWRVWKAIRVREPWQFRAAIDEYAGHVDGLHFDGWSPDAAGGTGVSFDWDALALERDALPDSIRLIVAGGLNPENVARAIELLRPDVVDVSSGVEISPGVKDPVAVPAFIVAATARQR